MLSRELGAPYADTLATLFSDHSAEEDRAKGGPIRSRSINVSFLVGAILRCGLHGGVVTDEGRTGGGKFWRQQMDAVCGEWPFGQSLDTIGMLPIAAGIIPNKGNQWT